MRPVLLFSFFNKVDLIYSAPRYSPKTRGRVRQVCRELLELAGPRATTAALTTELMSRYVLSRGPDANPNTVNGLLSTASSICTLAHDEGRLDRLPLFKRVRLRPAPMTLNRPPDHQAVGQLLRHLLDDRHRGWQQGRLCALVWTLALTGMRLGEAVHLERGDLRPLAAPLEARVDPRRARLKSAAAERTVALPGALTAILEDWLPRTGCRWVFPGARRRGPWTGGSARDRPLGQLQQATRAAGIGHATAHSLRHAFATAAFSEWAMPPWVIQRVLGHRDIRTTMAYAHLEGARQIGEAMRPITYG